MRLFTICLLFFSALAHAGNGDFLKVTINGRPYAIQGMELAVFHESGGTDAVPFQYYMVRTANSDANKRLQLEFTLRAGADLKKGTYAVPVPYDSAGPPWAQLYLEEGPPTDAINWTISNPEETEIVITAIRGQVVEGTFHARLTGTISDSWVTELTDGSFRFTMK